jgi:diguanylate cyclase (GGDEF)-like protein/PAS domain S-box-containing protein
MTDLNEQGTPARDAALAAAVLGVLALGAALWLPVPGPLAQSPSAAAGLHLLLGLADVTLAVLIAVAAWLAFEPEQARGARVLLAGFTVVAVCSLMDLLAGEGMPLALRLQGTEWFAAARRLAGLLALGLLAAPPRLAPTRGMALVLGLCAGLALAWAGVRGGAGTWLDGTSTVVVAVALAAAGLLLAGVFWRRLLYLPALACLALALSEVAFALEHEASFAHTVGHVYALLGYGLVCRMAFGTYLRQPYESARRSERQLRNSEARLRSLSDHLPNCVVYQVVRGWDGDVRFTHVSEAVEHMNGLRAEDVLRDHRLLFGQIIDEDQPLLRDAVRDSAATLQAFDIVVRVRRTDGALRWFRMCSAPRQLEDRGIAWDGVQIDITDEKLAEQEMNRSAALMRTMIDHLPLEIWVRDAEGRMVLENLASVKRNGSRLGRLIEDAAVPATVLAQWRENNRRALAGELVEAEVQYPLGDEIRTFYSLQAPIRANGDVQGIVGINMDITERKRAEALLHEKESELASILLHVPGGVSRMDGQLRFLFVNQAHADWFGRPVDQIVGRTLQELVAPERYQRMLPNLQRALRGETLVFENQVLHDSGTVHYRHTSIIPERSPRGDVIGLVVFATDTTERKHMELALAENQARLSALVRAIPDMVFLKDVNGAYLSCNPETERFFGLKEAQILGKTDFDLHTREMAEVFRARDQRVMETGVAETFEEWMTYAENGYRGLFETIKTPIRDADGRITGVLGVARDITARKRAEQEVERLAFYDSLTNLPNRRLLLDRLQHAVSASARSESHGALLFIDLDNFKDLNDTLGHDMGDRLLEQVAQRLVTCIRESDTVARFGGDEFVVMVENLSLDAEEAITEAGWVGEKILIALNQPYALGGAEHHSTPSVGIVLFRGNTQSVDDLLKRADMAMYQAKAAGRNTLCFFDPDMQAAVSARSALEADLRQGLQRQELLLYYQAVVDAEGRLQGAEALVRWQHPQRGLVSPAAFIPLAEQTGLILPLGQWVLQSACEQLVAWQRNAATQGLSIAVNVSARQFRHPDFVAQVLEVLRLTGARPQRLKLELTESLLLQDVEDIIAKMNALKSRGVGFSLDDFGTGYSSLSYLKRLPLDQLKIDQSFVRDVLSDPNDAAIAKTILALAHSLDLQVVAEGVESQGQLEFLKRNGCRAFQGYLFGRPAPVQVLEQALAASASA